MTGPLRTALADYLTMRRALGYRLARPEKLLGQFLDYLEQAGADVVTVEHALSFNLSYRDIEELVAERGVEVDHVTVFRWVHGTVAFTDGKIDESR